MTGISSSQSWTPGLSTDWLSSAEAIQSTSCRCSGIPCYRGSEAATSRSLHTSPPSMYRCHRAAIAWGACACPLLLSQKSFPGLVLDAETPAAGTQGEAGPACTNRPCRECKEQEFASSQTAGAALLMMELRIVLLDVRSVAGLFAAMQYGICSLQ